MKKYCLNLMGLDHYRKKRETNSEILQDIKAFTKKLKVPLTIQNNGIVVGKERISVLKLNQAYVRRQLFNWIMEEYSE